MALLGVNTRAKPLGTVRPPREDLDIARLNIRGDRKVVANAKASTESVELIQTIDGASTLTLKIRDWHRGLLRSSIPQYASTLELDGIEYTLCKVSHAADQVTLIFEETAVNLCRSDKTMTPKKANRDNTTRAQFIRGLIADAATVGNRRIPFNCPELNIRQPVGGG